MNSDLIRKLNEEAKRSATEQEKPSTAETLLFVFFSIVVMFPIGSIASGFVISKLWGWFIVPTFAVAPLKLPIAMGISLILLYLKAGGKTTDKEGYAETIGRWITWLTAFNAIVLGYGWLIHKLMQ